MKKVLIIEDCEDVRGVIKDILKARGYTTLEADNYSKGYQMAKDEKPDTILCGNGLELAIQLVKDNIIEKNNIIGMSLEPWRRYDWKEQGIAFIEIPPINLDYFYDQIEEH